MCTLRNVLVDWEHPNYYISLAVRFSAWRQGFNY